MMVAPELVQFSHAGGSGQVVFHLSGVGAGNTLAIIYGQNGGVHRSYSTSDDINGLWTQGARGDESFNRKAGIDYVENTAGGDLTITLTANAGSAAVRATVVEITPSLFDTSGFDTNSSNTNNHPCGLVNTASDVFVLAGGTLATSSGNASTHPDYTLLTNHDDCYLFQYRRSDGPLVGEHATWHSTVGRAHTCVIASFTALPASLPSRNRRLAAAHVHFARTRGTL